MPVIDESGYRRHLRILAVATGLGTIIFTLLALPTILEQQSQLIQWFYWPATVLFCGLPVLLVPLGRWGTIAWIVAIARTHTLVAVLLVALWVPAMLDDSLPGDRAPWVLNTLAVAAATAVIAWPARVAWGYVVALATGGAVLRHVVLGSTDWVVPFLDGISMLSFCAIIATLLIVTLRAGMTQDFALAQALVDASAAAEAESLARQRVRFGSLVHDQVITTLLAATQDSGSGAKIQESARLALIQLDEFVSEPVAGAPVAARAIETDLRSAAREIVDGVVIVGSLGGFIGTVPATVAAAMAGALGEGVRNSVRHAEAGQHVSRTVTLDASEKTLTVELTDDGSGFEPANVPQARLGIRTSIVGRMVSVGGAARVISTPGIGTRVTISWSGGSKHED